MEEELKTTGIVFAIILVIVFGLSLVFLDWGSFLEKRRTDQRRDIFKSSQSYNEGKIQDLLRYRLEYNKADREGKKILADTIRHMFADFDESKIKIDKLRVFLKKIKYGEN